MRLELIRVGLLTITPSEVPKPEQVTVNLSSFIVAGLRLSCVTQSLSMSFLSLIKDLCVY